MGDEFCLRDCFKLGVRFEVCDIAQNMPPGPFDLVMCRNLAFTYFAPEIQQETFRRLNAQLRAGGYFVIGAHERLPFDLADYEQVRPNVPVFRKTGNSQVQLENSRPAEPMMRAGI